MSQIFAPNSIEEACKLLAVPGRISCAGATNLYVDRYLGKYLDFDIVSLHKLKELKNISHEADGWHIGSLCTFDMLENELADCGVLNALAQASSLVGGPQIRNRGTIGGNIVSASPSADSVPVLMALDAKVVLKSIDSQNSISGFDQHSISGFDQSSIPGFDQSSIPEFKGLTDRQLPICDFMTGVKRTAIKPDELLTEIIIPDHDGQAAFQKIGKRNALAIALCNICVYMKTATLPGDHSSVIIEKIAIAIGSCAPTCVRARSTEEALMGRRLPKTDEEWKEIRALISDTLSEAISPIDDVRAKASYRRKVAVNVVYKLVKNLWETKR